MILGVIAAIGATIIVLNIWHQIINSHEDNKTKLQTAELCVWSIVTMICSYIQAVSTNCTGVGAIIGVWVANCATIILICGIIVGIKRVINKKNIIRFALNTLWIVSTFIYAINLLPLAE